MNNKKGFAILPIILIIAGVLVVSSTGVYLYKSNQQEEIKKQEVAGETDNWKTYRNDKYGFEMKYPQNWEVKSNLYISEIINEKVENFSFNEVGGNKCSLLFGIKGKNENKNLMDSLGLGGEFIDSGSSVNILGKSIKKTYHTINNRVKIIFYPYPAATFELNNNEASAYFHCGNNNDIKLFPEFEIGDQILSTFKFIKN